MESLESKLERLNPVQRQEVEDFVDFLLSRGMIRDFPNVHPAPPPLMNGAPPQLTMIEPVHIAVTGQFRETSQSPAGPVPVPSESEDPAAGIQEINVGGDDGNYLDYGKFEQPALSPSPAIEAVRKVKEKLNRREEHDKTGHILEWID
jgi:hypothetical protein